MRSGSAYGSGFRSTALTTEKTAVFAPMPSASVATAAAANSGRRLNSRHEYLRSLAKDSMPRMIPPREPYLWPVSGVGLWRRFHSAVEEIDMALGLRHPSRIVRRQAHGGAAGVKLAE